MAGGGDRIRLLHRHDIGRLVICHDMITKTLNVQNKLVIVKTAREKFQDRCKGKSIRITPDFSMEKPGNLDEHSSSSERPQMPAETMTAQTKEKYKTFHNKNKFKKVLSIQLYRKH